MDPLQLASQIATKQLQDKSGSGASDPVADQPADVLGSFGKMLSNSLNQVNELQQNADKMTQQLATGGNVPLHQVMMASEKAEMGLELTMQIRNKLLAAYQEVKSMGV